MTVLDVVGLYYDAWANKKGDLSGVPLAPGFRFRGPVADFDDAEGFRAARPPGVLMAYDEDLADRVRDAYPAAPT